jgi:hypothetical protein
MRAQLGLALIFSLLPACSSPLTVDENEAALTQSSDGGWYLMRPDRRECAAPMCGGYFIRAVNSARTRCLDGTSGAECYVAALDWSATSYSDDERAKLITEPVVVHGLLGDGGYAAGSFANLQVAEVWSPSVAPLLDDRGYAQPSFTLYRAWDNGTRCITTPCPSTSQQELNSAQIRTIGAVDLSLSDANDKQLAAVGAALATPTGILVDGWNGWVSGPGGTMRGLVGVDFFLRVTPTGPGSSCGGRDGIGCADGGYCDLTMPNACGGVERDGVCKLVPRLCMELYKPVCGCDGNTYGNDCFRLQAHVQLDHDGACSP